MESDEVDEIRKQALKKEGFYNLQVFTCVLRKGIPIDNNLNNNDLAWIICTSSLGPVAVSALVISSYNPTHFQPL